MKRRQREKGGFQVKDGVGVLAPFEELLGIPWGLLFIF